MLQPRRHNNQCQFVSPSNTLTEHDIKAKQTQNTHVNSLAHYKDPVQIFGNLLATKKRKHYIPCLGVVFTVIYIYFYMYMMWLSLFVLPYKKLSSVHTHNYIYCMYICTIVWLGHWLYTVHTDSMCLYCIYCGRHGHSPISYLYVICWLTSLYVLWQICAIYRMCVCVSIKIPQDIIRQAGLPLNAFRC